ncbi:HAMP domain-containing sensor histidine kinase [uncultured Sulfitobacter sp.]|uniref:sensor histidine kinase n=1 Tax=uncultured Sulfitobacter sp. TaxID=191468 RepID=UPI002612DF34|nr:HAMP domain-containing sensor histidine kinase [uncultured Sulfitobacter sp.]
MITRMRHRRTATATDDPRQRATQIRDYADVGRTSMPQRMIIYTSGLLMQAMFIGIIHAAISAVLVIVAEMYDRATFAHVRRMDPDCAAQVRATLRRIHLGTVYSAGIIGYFAASLTLLQSQISEFVLLLYLLTAAIFATMNSHQIVSVLVIRLAVYGAVFLLIPLRGLALGGASFAPEMWFTFLTSLLVLYFVVDSALAALRYYRISKCHLEQLKIENERAKAALLAKTEFLSTISHELRTPLTSVRAALDMTVAGAFGPLPDRSGDVLSIAQRNAARLGVLINELLDMQKIEAGKMRFDFERVQVAALIVDTVADNKPYASSLNVTLSMHPVDTDLYVRADRMRLEQVLTNLISNAAKFSDAGCEVRIGADALGGRVRITVRDEGAGIAQADRGKVFQSFSQIDSSATRKAGGTGLGLSISKRIIEAHGGQIDFTPNADRGTTFFVDLDRIAESARAPAREQTRAAPPLSSVREV